MTDPDAIRIATIAERLGELRSQRILAASRLCSELEAAIRPLNDDFMIVLVDKLQAQLSRRLSDRPDGDGSVGR